MQNNKSENFIDNYKGPVSNPMRSYRFFERNPCKVIKLIPNIAEFKAIRTGEHYIALIFGYLKRERRYEVTKLGPARYNLYLERQFNRLSKLAREGKDQQYKFLSHVIIAHSIL